MLKTGFLSALAFGLLLSSSSLADVVHLRDAAALRGTVEDHGDYLTVVEKAGAEPRSIPRHKVLFVEQTKGEAVHKVHGVIRGLLYKVGSSRIEERLEAHHALKQYAPGQLFRPLVKSLLHSRPQVRHFAAFQLGELGSKEALNDLVKVSLRDKDEGVRDAAFAATTKIGHRHLYFPFAQALFDSRQDVRLRAAKALGAIGDIRGIEHLVRRYAISGGGSGARSNFNSTTSQAYVKDFDVEVAQAAVIADPIIGVARSGAVLDAKVVGIYGTMTTIEKRVIAESLEDLSGRSFGPQPRAWIDWWKAEQAAKKTTAAKTKADQ